MSERLTILHEDADLLVVSKPAGLVCHGAPPERGSLIDRIRRHLQDESGRLVNRLDRETSGVVLVARGPGVARELGRLLSDGGMEKTYRAIVHGHLTCDLVIDEPIGPAIDSAVAIRDAVRVDGAPARTDVRPVRRLARAEGPFTEVEVVARTGRKHQIRVHLAHAGHPVVGDKIYGADETIYLRFVTRAMTPADTRTLLLPYHALHATRLAFDWRGRSWAFTADPEPWFTAFAGA